MSAAADFIVSQAIRALRLLLRHPTHAASRPALITRLARLLVHDRVLSSSARATTYWLVGQYADEADLLSSTAPDLLRVAARGFADESGPAKMQILALSAKLLVLSHASSLPPHLRFFSSTFRYVVTLARYDESYAVRDRARFIAGLVAAAGLGAEETKVTLHADAFARGEDLVQEDGIDTAKPKVTVEEVRRILFDRKSGPAVTRSRQGGRLGSHVGASINATNYDGVQKLLKGFNQTFKGSVVYLLSLLSGCTVLLTCYGFRLHGLVHCTDVSLPPNDFAEETLDAIQTTVQVNISGTSTFASSGSLIAAVH